MQIKFERTARHKTFREQDRFKVTHYFDFVAVGLTFGGNDDFDAGKVNGVYFEEGFTVFVFFFKILMYDI